MSPGSGVVTPSGYAVSQRHNPVLVEIKMGIILCWDGARAIMDELDADTCWHRMDGFGAHQRLLIVIPDCS
jgi:hypothetical protein